MRISSKRYEEILEKSYKLQKEKDSLIRMLSGVIIHYGGKINISIPSTDSRTLVWSKKDDGTVDLESKVYGVGDKKAEFST